PRCPRHATLHRFSAAGPVPRRPFRARRRPRNRLREQERDSSARGPVVEGRGERRGCEARIRGYAWTAGSPAGHRQEGLKLPCGRQSRGGSLDCTLVIRVAMAATLSLSLHSVYAGVLDEPDLKED